MNYEIDQNLLPQIKKSLADAPKGTPASASLDTDQNTLELAYLNAQSKIINLTPEEYNKILKILQKDEAIKRLKILKVMNNVIKEFEKENVVYYSERQNAFFDGILYWVRNNSDFMEAIAQFEEEYNALVYHAQLTRFNFGTCLSLLYVSKNIEEWEYDMQDLTDQNNKGEMFIGSYVVNIDDGDNSEFGHIGIVRKNGGISRVY